MCRGIMTSETNTPHFLGGGLEKDGGRFGGGRNVGRGAGAPDPEVGARVGAPITSGGGAPAMCDAGTPGGITPGVGAPCGCCMAAISGAYC
jgi:hypothetical protein